MPQNMSLPEHRVGVACNPANLRPVAEIKDRLAHLMNEFCWAIESKVSNPQLTEEEREEILRCETIALERLEEGCMWAVKGLTKPRQ
jgi:hypothetical protein